MKKLSQWLFVLPFIFAAVGTDSVDQQLVYALRAPHELAVSSVKQMGGVVLENLQKMAFNDKWPMKTRWKAFMVYTHVKGKDSHNVIKKAMISKTWYMRSAGLTALKSIDPQGAKKWAYKLLSQDPALMVRMKAVEILKENPNEKVTELFWKKINSPDSIHRRQSLWIRGDMARILMHQPRSKDLKRWLELLHQSDAELQKIASVALNKIHQSPETSSTSVSYWQQKYPKTK